jgi:hypothetical protein
MKSIFLSLLTCCLSISGMTQSKVTLDLVGTWQTIGEKDTIKMIFNGASVRFDYGPDNPFSNADFLYKIENNGDNYILNYHMAEVSTSYNMKLWVINHDKIKYQVFENISKYDIKKQLADSVEKTGILVRIKNK